MIREFAEKHMKSSEIKIDTELNERLWNRGITSPPRRITVRMKRDEDGIVTISLPKEAKITEPVQENVEKEEAPKEAAAAAPEAEKASEPKKTEEQKKSTPKQSKKSTRAKSKS